MILTTSNHRIGDIIRPPELPDDERGAIAWHFHKAQIVSHGRDSATDLRVVIFWLLLKGPNTIPAESLPEGDE